MTNLLICAIAALGFAFDTYELLMLPLVMPLALTEFGFKPGTPEFGAWAGLLFWVPAIAGGIFGLLGGWLTDRLGRRRVLTGSILLYAVATAGTAFATSPAAFLVLRTLTFIGVCVEFVAAVAWLAELFPDPKKREQVLGYTQAFGSLGGLMVTFAFKLCVKHGADLPAVMGAHAAWRYTLLSGLIPALPLILVRPFLPESPVWLERRAAGTLQRPSPGELFSPALLRTTVVTTIAMAAGFAVAFGALQQLPRIVPGLASLKDQPLPAQQAVVASVQLAQECGGLLGRLVLAFLATVIVSRRNLLRVFQVPCLIVVPLVFANATALDASTLQLGVFFCGFLTVGQFSFWGNYLPRVFPVHLRGTGEGMAANVGGRMLGTSAAWITSTLATSALMAGVAGPPPQKLALTAALVAGVAILIGLTATAYLPEPPAGEP